MLLNGLEISKIMKEKHISWDEAVVIWKTHLMCKFKCTHCIDYIDNNDQKCQTECVQDSAP